MKWWIGGFVFWCQKTGYKSNKNPEFVFVCMFEEQLNGGFSKSITIWSWAYSGSVQKKIAHFLGLSYLIRYSRQCINWFLSDDYLSVSLKVKMQNIGW